MKFPHSFVARELLLGRQSIAIMRLSKKGESFMKYVLLFLALSSQALASTVYLGIGESTWIGSTQVVCGSSRPDPIEPELQYYCSFRVNGGRSAYGALARTRSEAKDKASAACLSENPGLSSSCPSGASSAECEQEEVDSNYSIKSRYCSFRINGSGPSFSGSASTIAEARDRAAASCISTHPGLTSSCPNGAASANCE